MAHGLALIASTPPPTPCPLNRRGVSNTRAGHGAPPPTSLSQGPYPTCSRTVRLSKNLDFLVLDGRRYLGLGRRHDLVLGGRRDLVLGGRRNLILGGRRHLVLDGKQSDSVLSGGHNYLVLDGRRYLVLTGGSLILSISFLIWEVTVPTVVLRCLRHDMVGGRSRGEGEDDGEIVVR